MIWSDVRRILVAMTDARLLEPKIAVVEDDLVVRINLNALGTHAVVWRLRMAFRRASLVDDDLVGIDLDALA